MDSFSEISCDRTTPIIPDKVKEKTSLAINASKYRQSIKYVKYEDPDTRSRGAEACQLIAYKPSEGASHLALFTSPPLYN